MEFLTIKNLEHISNWKYKVQNNEYLTPYINPWLNSLEQLIPRSISPNLLTLLGFFSSFLAFLSSTFSPFLTGLFTLTYMILDDLDGKHARRTKSSSPLGEIFDHFCDCFTNILLVISFCNIFEIENPTIIWGLIRVGSQLFALEHLKAFRHPNKMIVFSEIGPTELLIAYSFLIMFSSYIPTNNFLFELIGYLAPLGLFIISVILIGEQIESNDTKNVLIIAGYNIVSLVMPSYFYFLNGVLFSLLISDLIVSKMANKDLNSNFLILMALGLINPLFAFLVPFIYISIIIQIAYYLRIPIIEPQTRIFVSGYYDGFHQGHINSLKRAKELGSKLVVGVHSDIDSEKYKNKKPMNSIEERVKKVEECKYVDEVIVDCQQIFDKEFMEKNQIDYIGMSDEYIYIDGTIHESYQYAKSIDRILLIQRTPGFSSTQLREQLETKDKQL